MDACVVSSNFWCMLAITASIGVVAEISIMVR